MSLDQNVIEDQNFLEMTYRWFEPYHKMACIFFIVWNILSAFLFHEEFIRLVSGQMSVLRSAAAMSLFVSLWLIPSYWILVLTLNRTIIQLTRKEMVVWHGPLPCFTRNNVFSIREMRSIWLENAYPDAEEGDGATDVIVILRNGEERKVLKNVKNTQDSEIIRDRINAWLKKTAGSSRVLHKPMPPSNPVVNDLT